MTAPPLVLVDGHNLLWRGAFGFPARITARDGEDRTGVFAFFALLRVAQRELPPDSELIVCFDGEHGARERQAEDDDYKSNRTDIDLSPLLALPDVKRGLDSISVRWVELDDSECDDVIATLSEREGDRRVVIFSTDKDFFQLLDARVDIFNQAAHPHRRRVCAEDVVQRFGVTPEQWCDFRALTGDPADAIPGVRGVGARTAARLLQQNAALEDLRCLGRLSGVVGARIEEVWDDILRWRSLIRLQRDIAVPAVSKGESTATLPKPADMLQTLALW